MRSRAAVCHAFGGPHAVEDVLLREPRGDEVLVRVEACAVCHSDVSAAEGAWGGELPAVYGHEAAGTVVEAGAGVARAQVGDAVVVTLIRACGRCRSCLRGEPALCLDDGPVDSPLSLPGGRRVVQGMRTAAFARHVLVHESQVVPVPPDVPRVTASLLGCGVLTGVGAAVRTAAIEDGARVVVLGAGGVGLSCVQGARLAGAATIVAVDPVPAKREAAAAVGATHTVDAASADVVGAVREVAGADGADYVLVATGARSAVQTALELLARGGTAVLVGMPPSGSTVEIDPTELAHHGRRIVGSKLGSARPDADIPWLVDLYRDGRLELDGLVSGTFPLERLDEAMAEVRAGAALRNVVVPGG